MCKLFVAEGLPDPPLPARLVPQLLLQRPRWYSTQAPCDWPYFFGLYLERLSRPRVEDQVTIALAGDSVNAYGLSYYLALGELRILVQLAWGEWHLTEDAYRARIATIFGVLHEEWPTLERSFAKRRSIAPSLIACSDFYPGLIQLEGRQQVLAPRTSPELVVELVRAFARSAEWR